MRDDPRHLEQAGVLVGVGCIRQHVGDIEAGMELVGPFRRVAGYDMGRRRDALVSTCCTSLA